MKSEHVRRALIVPMTLTKIIVFSSCASVDGGFFSVAEGSTDAILLMTSRSNTTCSWMMPRIRHEM